VTTSFTGGGGMELCSQLDQKCLAWKDGEWAMPATQRMWLEHAYSCFSVTGAVKSISCPYSQTAPLKPSAQLQWAK